MFNEFMDNYTQSILIFMGINIVAAYSFFAPFKTGQVSIGQAGFMAVGAYGSAVFSQKFGLPFIISVPLAGLIAGVVGVVIGFPALRIKGIYLLLLTLGFSEIIQVVVLSWDYVGGAQGYRNIPFNRRTLEWVVAVVVLLIFFFGRLERSSLGRAMDSIHQDETAAEVMGIDVVRIKLFAFGIGAGIAGVAGALYAHQATYIELDHLQRDDVGRNPYFRRGWRWQHVLGSSGGRDRAVVVAPVPAHAPRMASAGACGMDRFLSDEPDLRFPVRVPRFRERQTPDRLRPHSDGDDDRAA